MRFVLYYKSVINKIQPEKFRGFFFVVDKHQKSIERQDG